MSQKRENEKKTSVLWGLFQIHLLRQLLSHELQKTFILQFRRYSTTIGTDKEISLKNNFKK